jgi:hypothetical protein
MEREGIDAVWGCEFIRISAIEIAVPKVFNLMVMRGMKWRAANFVNRRVLSPDNTNDMDR